MAGTTIRINLNKLGDVAAKLPEVIDTAITKFVLDVDAHATSETPVDTGYLMNSKTIELEPGHGQISWGADYAGYVHDGTRYMAARPFAADAVEKVEPALRAALSNLEDQLT